MLNKETAAEYERKIGYTFKNKYLLENALTHSSYVNEHGGQSNQRMEFLGDSVLSIIISDKIFRHMKNVDEGVLTKTRATLVCEEGLDKLAVKIDLGSMLLLGKGEELMGGRKKASIIADAFEALLAAIYLDSGLKKAAEWLMNIIEPELNRVMGGEIMRDAKTELQEYVQHNAIGDINYEVLKKSGADHCKWFKVAVKIGGKRMGDGSGNSKQSAEQQAAKMALEALRGKKKQ